jgi:putative sterol carrier protein
MDGAVPRHVVDRTLTAMPYVVGRKVKPDNGTTVVIEVTGSISGFVSIEVNGGRANRVDDIPVNPTVSLRMDFQTFTCLGCGRLDTTEVVISGKVVITGDQDIGENIIHQMAIVS